MKGSYDVKVENRRLQYKFRINRNVTILRGDSATGKTTLIDMIAAHQQNGDSSGVTISCKVPCVVLTSMNWKINLSQIKNSIVFIDEGDAFVKTKDFARAVQESSNYYVIATRSSLFNLPYSVSEVYNIRNKSGNRYQGTKRTYSGFTQLYPEQFIDNGKPEKVVVEDSHSGFEFFKAVCDEKETLCETAAGNSNIYELVNKSSQDRILIVADGAAFGPEMERILSLNRIKKISIYLPESFEWIVLKSGVVNGSDIGKILKAPSEYIESSQYFTWEQFFTALLVKSTANTYLAYQKHHLNESYLQGREKKAILDAMLIGDK